MSQPNTDRLRALLAQGWTLMFMVFTGNLIIDLIKNEIRGNGPEWAQHLGMPGVKLLLVVMAIYVVMPMLIRTFDAHLFRLFVVVMSVLMGLFVGAHELSHLAPNDKPFGILHTLDLTHHLLVIWVTVTAIRWVRLGQPAHAAPASGTATNPAV